MKSTNSLSTFVILGAVLTACAAPAPDIKTAVPGPSATNIPPILVATATLVPPQVTATNRPPTAVPSPLPTAIVISAVNSPIATPTAPPPTPIPYSAGVLYIVSHDSYAIGNDLIKAFEVQTGSKVQILKVGDAGAALNKSLLSRGNPLGDVFFGVDNTFLSRALDADLFESYAPVGLSAVPAELKLDKTNRLIPIDVGYVTINYDIKLKNPPSKLEELAKPAYKGMLAVENPATSSPGLAFLLTTIAYFGETGAYTWKDYWKDLRANDVLITAGWSEAYYDNFTAAGGAGTGKYPFVVSYASSPAAEVFYSEGALLTPPSANLLPPKGAFKQVEFAGILKGAKNPELARKWLDFMLTAKYQQDVYASMAVYPVVPNIEAPPAFAKFAPIPSVPANITPEQIAANRDKWIKEWTTIVLR